MTTPTPAVRRVLALTLWRPWASCIVHGTKRVENRGWRAPDSLRADGVWLAIHAGRRYDREAAEDVEEFIEPLHPRHKDEGIVGVCRVVDCVSYRDRPDDPWSSGPWCWVLDDVIALPEPIPAKGAQGLWTPGPEVVAALRAAAGEE